MTRERRWIVGLAIVATLSLALNLVVAGIVIAHRSDPPPPPFNLGSPGVIEQMFRDLSPEGRAVMLESMRDGRKELRDSFKALREMKREIKHIIEADTVDQVALTAALDRLAALTTAVQTRLQQAFIEGVVKLSIEDRKRLRPGPPPPGDGPPPQAP
jgi:uncharacterized membrane protein